MTFRDHPNAIPLLVDHPRSMAASTRRQVTDAEDLSGTAHCYSRFADAARNIVSAGEDVAEIMKLSYDEVSELLADALRKSGNWEPEMAEALEALERARAEHREFF